MIAHSVAPEHVYVERGEVPDLDDRQRAEYVRYKSVRGNKAVLKVTEKSVVAAHYIYKYQVVYELEIFYFPFFLFQH